MECNARGCTTCSYASSTVGMAQFIIYTRSPPVCGPRRLAGIAVRICRAMVGYQQFKPRCTAPTSTAPQSSPSTTRAWVCRGHTWGAATPRDLASVIRTIGEATVRIGLQQCIAKLTLIPTQPKPRCKIDRQQSMCYGIGKQGSERRCTHRQIVVAATPGGVESAVGVLLVDALIVAAITCHVHPRLRVECRMGVTRP